ncbi:peptide chain release factor 2 [Helicobacter monodelphidis]|uniref:peptide chain release factor 2 n=1 Tax=Helicobacter sp. 15-1451 TaxID=2004995 RepID=UPI000DCF1AC7|nr:peptide chain release factor 2 [Helicobacter sp. 15-1451]RAX57430.1 peptide chain release factor 2 [Helicobacter sp. 15-1451]
MDIYEYGELLKILEIKIENIKSIIRIDKLHTRLDDIAKQEQDPIFWENAKQASELQKEKRHIERVLDKYYQNANALKDARELFEIATSEDDASMLDSLFQESVELEKQLKGLEIEVMLNGEYDSANAILTIHPGAGGTESQDWASMLYRMYLRYSERKGFKVELLDYQEGEEAGIKDVSFLIKGDNAYGYLKVESGIHRLVRISPFDANGKRHTSFSSVVVSPEIDDDIEIEILDKDIRIDTYRASGAGGQHINKTESAVRITHIPTCIVVQCQNDRSQHKNKATAFKMLKSRLYELEMLKKTTQGEVDIKGENGWGYQIRNYVLYPYQQVKDVRSNLAYSNTEAILDGDLDDILEGVLIANAQR